MTESRKILLTEYSFTHLGFDVDVYSCVDPSKLTVSISDPLHGVEIFHYPAIQITADLMKFAIDRIQEKISKDEEV